jgi:hypothetical protein
MESSNTSQSRNKSKEKISTRDISLLAGTLGLPQVFMLWSFFLEKKNFYSGLCKRFAHNQYLQVFMLWSMECEIFNLVKKRV